MQIEKKVQLDIKNFTDEEKEKLYAFLSEWKKDKRPMPSVAYITRPDRFADKSIVIHDPCNGEFLISVIDEKIILNQNYTYILSGYTLKAFRKKGI